MLHIDHILCPIDFSDFSRHAIDHALAIAHCYNARITGVHVLPPIPYSDPMYVQPFVFTPDDIERVQTAAAKFVAEETGRATIDTVVRQGYVADQIVAEARTADADMIVMGTHGRSGFDRLVLGSVTERVLRKAPCPVLTVPKKAGDVVPTASCLFANVLCAVDFSPASMNALNYALSLATRASARLTVMHVLEPGTIAEPATIGALEPVNREPMASGAARKRIRETLIDLGASNFADVVAIGKPYREILRVAAEQHSDVIAIGAHSEPLGALAFGSTTNHVVRAAECPVLTLTA